MSAEPSPDAVRTAAAPQSRPSWRTSSASPAPPSPTRSLVADDVTRHFGGMTAVDVDHVEVQRGAITALIGPNGAGKTTLFNLLTGFDKPSSGHLVVRRPVARRASRPPGRPRPAWSARSSSPRRSTA